MCENPKKKPQKKFSSGPNSKESKASKGKDAAIKKTQNLQNKNSEAIDKKNEKIQKIHPQTSFDHFLVDFWTQNSFSIVPEP